MFTGCFLSLFCKCLKVSSAKKYLYKTDRGYFGTKQELNNSYAKHPGRGPYISAGGYYTKMRQAQANVDLNYDYYDPQIQYSHQVNSTKNNIDVKQMRNTKRFGLTAAIGSTMPIKRILISLEAKYLYDLSILNNLSERYSNPELLYEYYYIDNNFSVNRLDFSLSLAYILNYNIKSKIK